MRQAIARDFAAVPGIEVVMPVDSRLTAEDEPGIHVHRLDRSVTGVIESLAAASDYSLLIAPETDGILEQLTERVEQAGGRSIGSRPRAIGLTGDKARLAHHFYGAGIRSPQTYVIEPSHKTLPGDWEGPSLVKPRDGAGSVETRVVHDRRRPDWLTRRAQAIVQPYLPGEPMSASFLVDVSGGLTLLGVGRQDINVDRDGRISYRGGIILSSLHEAPEVVIKALSSVNEYLGSRRLRGFVGVDYLADPASGVTVLEINPRPTTSYVGLAKRLGSGTIAGAWLDSMEGPLAATDWPGRIRAARSGLDVCFDASGLT